MTDAIFVVHIHDLLSFALVSDVSFIIDTSCIVPSSSIMVHSPGHQGECYVTATHSSTNLTKIALN